MPGGISTSAKAPSRGAQAARPRKTKAADEGLLSLDTRLDILGIVLIIIALVTLISFLSQEPGALTRIWLRFIYQLFGWGAFMVPLGLGAVGVWLIWRHFGEQLPPVDPIRILGAMLFFVALLVLMHAAVVAFNPIGPLYINPALANPATPGYTPQLVWEQAQACPTRPQTLINEGWVLANGHLTSYDIARCGNGGGLIGAFIQSSLQNLIGGPAVFVIAAVVLIGGALMTTRTTLNEALQWAAGGFRRTGGRAAAPVATAPEAAPVAQGRAQRGQPAPAQTSARGGQPAPAARGRPGPAVQEEARTVSPALQGRPSMVTGLGPGGSRPPSEPAAGAPAAGAPAGVSARSEMGSSGLPRPAGAGAQPAPGAPDAVRPGMPPGPGSAARTGPSWLDEEIEEDRRRTSAPGTRPGTSPSGQARSAGAPPVVGGRPSGLPGAPGQAPPRPGSAGPAARPAADEEDEEDEGPGVPGGQGPLPRPGVPTRTDRPEMGRAGPGIQPPGQGGAPRPAGARPGETQRPGTAEQRTGTGSGLPGGQGARPGTGPLRPGERAFGPQPPSSMGGPRPAPKPVSPPRPEETPSASNRDLRFDDLSRNLDARDGLSDLEGDDLSSADDEAKPRPGTSPPGIQAAGPTVPRTEPRPAGTETDSTPGARADGNNIPLAAAGGAAVAGVTPGTAQHAPAARPSTPQTSQPAAMQPPAPTSPAVASSAAAAVVPRPGTPPAATRPPGADGPALAERPAAPTGPAAVRPPRIEHEREKSAWQLPPTEGMLEAGGDRGVSDEEVRKHAEIIEQTLASFGAPARVVEVNRGPVITQFGLEPDYIDGRAGKRVKVKVGKISALADDLALALSAPSIRIEAPVPGKGFVGVEVPNEKPSIVQLREVMDTEVFRTLKSPLKLALGQNVSGEPIVADLTGMPHLLIAGTTGSGKSVCVNGIICTMLMTCKPDELKMIMVDPKRVELTNYNGIPHLMAPVVTELERIVGVLKWVQREMDDRYRKFAMAGARNITDYNGRIDKGQTEGERLPYIILIVDELADLMMLAPDETERVVTRLAQMARATGIHIIISTQRPSVDVVTGLIKANFPARIAFAVATGVDSRVILDMPGAEKLLGRGDMLFQSPDAPMPVRLQGVYVSDAEIQRIVDFWRKQAAKMPVKASGNPLAAPPGGAGSASAAAPSIGIIPSSRDDEEEGADDLFDEAVELVRDMGKASISLLQRHLRIGYTRAARLIDLMEERGVIGPAAGGSMPRVVLDEDGNPISNGTLADDDE